MIGEASDRSDSSSLEGSHGGVVVEELYWWLGFFGIFLRLLLVLKIRLE